jgi:hypothetical protein
MPARVVSYYQAMLNNTVDIEKLKKQRRHSFWIFIILLLQLKPYFLQLNHQKLQLNVPFLQLNIRLLQLNLKID